MASYIVKLVDHTSSSDNLKQRIQTRIQGLFDEVFVGTPDDATVEWGTGDPSDTIVLHFVRDVPASYIVQQMPGGSVLAPHLAGHTRTRAGVTGSEFYKFVLINGTSTMVTDIAYAKAAFHEAMHNQYPYWSNDDMHGPDGGFGLAASPPQLPMTDRNKALMRAGMAIKTKQLLRVAIKTRQLVGTARRRSCRR